MPNKKIYYKGEPLSPVLRANDLLFGAKEPDESVTVFDHWHQNENALKPFGINRCGQLTWNGELVGKDIPEETLTQIETNKTDIFDLQDDVGGLNDIVTDLDPIVRDNESKLATLEPKVATNEDKIQTLSNKQTLIADGSLTIDLSLGIHCFITVEDDAVITLESSDTTPFCLYFSNSDEHEVTITDAVYLQGTEPRILSTEYQVIGDFDQMPKISGIIETIDEPDLMMMSVGGDEA